MDETNIDLTYPGSAGREDSGAVEAENRKAVGDTVVADGKNGEAVSAGNARAAGAADAELEPFLAHKRIENRPLRWLLIAAGSLSLGLGIAGIPLPILPTTPFLLISAWCFGRTSEPLLRWLLTNRLFGEYLRGYVQNRGIPLRIKKRVLAVLWICILSSSFLLIDKWWPRAALLTVAVAVTVHILRIPTANSGKK